MAFIHQQQSLPTIATIIPQLSALVMPANQLLLCCFAALQGPLFVELFNALLTTCQGFLSLQSSFSCDTIGNVAAGPTDAELKKLFIHNLAQQQQQ